MNYTPRRIADYLQHLACDYSEHDSEPIDLRGVKWHKRVFPNGPYQHSSEIRCDLERAFRECTPVEIACVLCSYLLELQTDRTADLLGLSQADVTRLAQGGVYRMARTLGWRAPSESIPDEEYAA